MSSETSKQNSILSAQLEKIVKHYLETIKEKTVNNKNNPELEVRFGTSSSNAKPISNIDYNHVVETFVQNGWKCYKIEGDQYLRITSKKFNDQYEQVRENREVYNNENGNNDITGQGQDVEEKVEGGAKERPQQNNQRKWIFNNIRAELEGTDVIKSYCIHNDIEQLKDPSGQNPVRFTRKKRVINPETNDPFSMVDFKDFNFRVSYMNEEVHKITSRDKDLRRMIYEWRRSFKTFRSINRVRFVHDDYCVCIDLSIVKTNKKHLNPRTGHKNAYPKETVQEADVFDQVEEYEVELEFDNNKVALNSNNLTTENMVKELRHCIRLVLSGLQETPYPISYIEQKQVIQDYMTCAFGEEWEEIIVNNKKNIKLQPYFIGPNSVSLKLKHLAKDLDNLSSTVSILDNYTVTEKADGKRCLMYVSKTGSVYLISYNLKVMFTGCKTNEEACFDSILDGEFLMYDKNGKRLFLFAAFDIYYFGGLKKPERSANVRTLPFASNNSDDLDESNRLSLMHKFHSLLSLRHSSTNQTCHFQFRIKNFILTSDEMSIFEASKEIWKDKDIGYEYEIDGLIYTPMNTGVGVDQPGSQNPLNGYPFTWNMSLKWKPPHMNTIDFLIEVVKDDDGQPLIKNMIHSEESVVQTVISYKTLKLYVNFNPHHDIGNTFYNTLHDIVPETYKQMGGNKTKPILFRPSNPYDSEAYLCYIPLNKQMQMKTTEGHIIRDDTIVEFAYDKSNESAGPWKWKPLRVREDKTQALREGKKRMNAYTTANDNWESIHYPVKESIITGHEEPVHVANDVYYNLKEKNSKQTHHMRKFHNLGVKQKLISGAVNLVSEKTENVLLIDYAVGKAGDLKKWSLTKKIDFVLGIDIHADNIHNKYDGACMRYLTSHRQDDNDNKLRAIFVEGNSSLNIRTKGDAFPVDLHKEIVQSIFGHGTNLNDRKYVFQHGIAHKGFHISSCQFSLHYFFENKTTLHSFMRNLAECTRLEGYFIGTCFDGMSLFNKLRKRQENGSIIQENESIQIMQNDRKIFEVTKKYSSRIQELKEDESCIGLSVSVYQESIGKEFIEYLVNFDYFVHLMEMYGFVVIDRKTSQKIGLPNGSGLFQECFNEMVREIQSNKNKNKKKYYDGADEMDKNEKFISFLNRYFVFQKVRELSPSVLDKLPNMMTTDVIDKEVEDQDDDQAEEPDKKEEDMLEKQQVNIDELDKTELVDNNDIKIKTQTKTPVKTSTQKTNKTRRKRLQEKITIDDDNYSPDTQSPDKIMEFENPNIQAYYETIPKSAKEEIAHLSVPEQKEEIKKQFNKISSKSS